MAERTLSGFVKVVFRLVSHTALRLKGFKCSGGSRLSLISTLISHVELRCRRCWSSDACAVVLVESVLTVLIKDNDLNVLTCVYSGGGRRLKHALQIKYCPAIILIRSSNCLSASVRLFMQICSLHAHRRDGATHMRSQHWLNS